jgi:hypothetical protein
MKLVVYNKKEVKEKIIILYLVKDWFIPHIIDKMIGKKMFDSFVGWFMQNDISTIHLSKIDIVVSYLASTTELKDQLVSIGTMVEDKKLVSITLNGLFSSWRPFVQGVYSCEKLPRFTNL